MPVGIHDLREAGSACWQKVPEGGAFPFASILQPCRPGA